MAGEHLNQLAAELREICARHVLEEKWLIAPSRRIGFQWLDAVTRSGQPALNVRVKTLAAMALELAAPEMERRDMAFAQGIQVEVLLDRALSRLRGKGGYISRLEASPGLVHATATTLRDLRLAGLTAEWLSSDLFEVTVKGREIAALLAAYEDELRSRHLVDYADILRMAAGHLADDVSALPPGALVILPHDMLEKVHALERALWEAVPAEKRYTLEVDQPCRDGCGDSSDAALLAWISRPAEAPPPRGDGTAEIFRALGEGNEVREVLRRCVERKIPFDQVEILHTDAATYVPLIYELASRHSPEPGGSIAVTFTEGVPVRYSRPGRALLGLLSWIRDDFPQTTLVRLIQDGLLEMGEDQAGEWSYSRLGAVLRAVPIGAGRHRYLSAIDAAISGLQMRANDEEGENGGHEMAAGEEQALLASQRQEMLVSLRSLVADLLEYAPSPGNSWQDNLEGMESFLLRRTRSPNEFDAYGRRRLLDEIADLAACLQGGDPACLGIMDWLSELARSSRVEGKGPRPGCLFVAPLAAGGHSGRSHTFIVGLDDARFPGPGLQDPLLLDAERERICGDLPTASQRLGASLEDLAALTARLRGCVTLSYSCLDLEDDRDMFPSPAVLSAYRILSGNREGVQDDLLEWLPPAASFIPRQPEGCLDTAEWWLHHLCGGRAAENALVTITQIFPHLGRGLEARLARESDHFTAYDGYVPQAGEDLDPTAPHGPVLSSSRLEELGRCPLEYFFHYVLELETPREYTVDPYLWLEPTEKGHLLHAVFRKFLCRLRAEDRKPVLERDRDLLLEILDMEVRAWRAGKPPPNRETFQAQVEELRHTSLIFLQEEEEHCRNRRPLYFEVAVGMEAVGEGNAMDTLEPATIVLPGGKTIRARGYIDRVDEMKGDVGSRFAVCDYKTGSIWDLRHEDPFQQGRRVQNALYLALAESRLAECHPGCEVRSFEYFFPNTREHGERVRWDREMLTKGTEIIECLCEMLARGCFPFSDSPEDVRYSDYRPAFGDVDGAARAVQAKLANPQNVTLAPFRKLRVKEGEG